MAVDMIARGMAAKAMEGGGTDLPDVTPEDDGKVLGVVSGAWNTMECLPPVTSTDSGKVLTVDELSGGPAWGERVKSLNGQTGDVNINFITGVSREEKELRVTLQDGSADYVSLPCPTVVFQLTGQQIEAGLAQVKSLADANPENLIKVGVIYAELCFTVVSLVYEALVFNGDMPLIQVANDLAFMFSGASQSGASIEDSGVSFRCMYGSYEWTMSFTLDGVVVITCIHHDNYTMMPGGDEHTISEVRMEIAQSVQAMSYGTLRANMESGNDFLVPMYTTGWDSETGQTEFTMEPNGNSLGYIRWAGVSYSVHIDWDDDQQTFNVTNVTPFD